MVEYADLAKLSAACQILGYADVVIRNEVTVAFLYSGSYVPGNITSNAPGGSSVSMMNL